MSSSMMMRLLPNICRDNTLTVHTLVSKELAIKALDLPRVSMAAQDLLCPHLD